MKTSRSDVFALCLQCIDDVCDAHIMLLLLLKVLSVSTISSASTEFPAKKNAARSEIGNLKKPL